MSWRRTLWGMAAGTAAAYPASYLSVQVAVFLFALNAPEAGRTVKAGWGFVLYYSAAAGWIVGAATAFVLVVGDSRLWLRTGVSLGVLLAMAAGWLAMVMRDEVWTGPDLMALPFCLATLLCVWGLVAQWLQRSCRQHEC